MLPKQVLIYFKQLDTYIADDIDSWVIFYKLSIGMIFFVVLPVFVTVGANDCTLT
jgi:hypothetical protein